MTESSRRRRAPALRMGLVLVAVLMAVAGGQSNAEHPEGGPPAVGDGGQGGPPEGGGGGGGEGQGGGPPQGGGGPPHGDGGEGDPHHGGGGGEGGGPPHGGPPHDGGEGDHHGMPGHHDGMMAGRDGLHEGHHPGDEGDFERPPVCTAEQAQAALEASSDYVSCSGLAYQDFMSLVHADVDLLEQAGACFTTSVKEMEHNKPIDKGEIEVEVDNVFRACVEQVEAADEGKSTEATTEFLRQLLGPDSKICSCLPAYVEKMPLCEMWARYHHLGLRIEHLCDHVDTAVMPIPDPDTQAEEAGQDAEEAAVTEIQDVDPNAAIDVKDSSQGPHLPNTYGPCPPGEEAHPTNPKECQPVQNSQDAEGGYGAPQGSEGRAPPPKGGGGIVGFGMSVVAVVAVGAFVGVGGVWVWGKFQSGTRQPGVRYMATGAVDNDIGTELGPFGREYP